MLSRDYDPPTISCSASTQLFHRARYEHNYFQCFQPAESPSDDFLYSDEWRGTISGSGKTATFSAPEGTPIGTANITCSVVDDKGHSASASTSVEVQPKPIIAKPVKKDLCSITFGKKTQPLDRVDNEAKGCLDEVAISLQKDPDAKLYVIGEEDAKERGPAPKGKNAKVNNKRCSPARR